MTISHIHARVKDLAGALTWFTSVCGVASSFTDARMAVFEFGALTLILDSATEDGAITIEFEQMLKPWRVSQLRSADLQVCPGSAARQA